MSDLKGKIKLSCTNLKLLAVVIMFIDHAAFALLHLYMQNHMFELDPNFYTKLSKVYEAMRGVGRMAFPIFAFFLVEGFFHTKSVIKYALRLALFAVISEVPFDLALYQTVYYDKHQNIMLTLLISLLAIWLLDYIRHIPGMSDLLRFVACLCTCVAALDLGIITNCDYKWYGILCVIALYLTREYASFNLLAGAASISWEKYAPISFMLLYFYDESQKPSKKLKYFFYLFYPAHLLLLYLIALLLHL